MGGETLLCIAALLSGAWPLKVSQGPAVQAASGSTVMLECSYSSDSEFTVGQYAWYKDPPGGPEVSNKSREFEGRVHRPLEQTFLVGHKANIELRDMRPYDSGLYVCEVELLVEGKPVRGNGTRLTVTGKGNDVAHMEESLGVLFILLLRGVCYTFGLILTGLASSLYFQRRRQSLPKKGGP